VGAGHADQDRIAVARDRVYIVRDTDRCPNKLGARPPATKAFESSAPFHAAGQSESEFLAVNLSPDGW
jgi:hypothetical protein